MTLIAAAACLKELMAAGLECPDACPACDDGPCQRGYHVDWTPENPIGKGPTVTAGPRAEPLAIYRAIVCDARSRAEGFELVGFLSTEYRERDGGLRFHLTPRNVIVVSSARSQQYATLKAEEARLRLVEYLRNGQREAVGAR